MFIEETPGGDKSDGTISGKYADINLSQYFLPFLPQKLTMVTILMP